MRAGSWAALPIAASANAGMVDSTRTWLRAVDGETARTLAMVAVRARQAYLGVRHSQAHLDALTDFLLARIFQAFQLKGDTLYQPKFADILDLGKEIGLNLS